MMVRLAKRWRKPMAQAQKIGSAKDKQSAVHYWATLVKEAIRGVPVSAMHGDAEPDLDAGSRPAVRGADGVGAKGPDSPRVSDRGGGSTRDSIEEAA